MSSVSFQNLHIASWLHRKISHAQRHECGLTGAGSNAACDAGVAAATQARAADQVDVHGQLCGRARRKSAPIDGSRIARPKAALVVRLLTSVFVEQRQRAGACATRECVSETCPRKELLHADSSLAMPPASDCSSKDSAVNARPQVF